MAAKGLYLHLYHGFPSEEARQEADDWGADGPTIGPLKYVHTTYAEHIKCETEGDTNAFWERYRDLRLHSVAGDVMFDLWAYDECIYINGMYYGDWTVFYDNGES